MQVLFESERRECDVYSALRRDAAELGEIDSDHAETVLGGVLEHQDQLRSTIEKYAPGWTYEKMDPIARCVLLVGAYELLFTDDVPPAVVMNESIDIAKEYGTDESAKFVNGVLNAIAHRQ